MILIELVIAFGVGVLLTGAAGVVQLGEPSETNVLVVAMLLGGAAGALLTGLAIEIALAVHLWRKLRAEDVEVGEAR
jgi:hypothetical protein